MGVILPVAFSSDGPFPDYEALLRALLALIDPRLPNETRVTEYWDAGRSRVRVRLTLFQTFRYTMSLDIHGQQVDVLGVLEGLNTMLDFMEEPGRFFIDSRSREVRYKVRGAG